MKYSKLCLLLTIIMLGCESETTKPEDTIPIVPSDLLITDVKHHNISISWTDNSTDEEGFIIERSSMDSINFDMVDSVALDVFTFTDTGLVSGTTYFYRVTAYNTIGNSPYSNTVSALTLVSTLALISGVDSISVGQTIGMNLQIIDFIQPVFGISMQIEFDPTILSVVDSIGFEYSDFFGSEVVTFAQAEYDAIYLTVSLIQGQPEVYGSGNLGQLTFSGISAGSTEVLIIPSELNFYDSAGEIISIDNLQILSSTIVIQ